MKDFDKTIISQYSSAPIITQLITNLNQYIDPSANLDAFYNLLWCIDTAQGYGLDVWGRIVGLASRYLPISAGSYFGFSEANDRVGFGQGPFYNGEITTTQIELSDSVFRRLIFAKAAANITNCSIPAINQILRNLFPNRGNTYVTDGANTSFSLFFGFGEAGDRGSFGQACFIDNFKASLPMPMTMTYVFDFALSATDLAIVNSGVLPKPVGVLSSVQISPGIPAIPAPPSPPVYTGVEAQPHFIGRYYTVSGYNLNRYSQSGGTGTTGGLNFIGRFTIPGSKLAIFT